MRNDAWIDISYPVREGMAIYPGNPPYHRQRVLDIDNGDTATVSLIHIGSHTGTHIDAPAHIIPGGETIDRMSLDRMNGRAKVVDVTGLEDIDTDVIKSITIQRDDILLFKTDNSLKWECDKILDDYVTLTYDAAGYLADLGVKLVGIDYLTVERPRNKRVAGKSVHEALLGKSVLIIEGLDLKSVDPGEYELICVPLNIESLDGCPVRCIIR